MTRRHDDSTTVFDIRRSHTLDALIDAEEKSLAIWARLVSDYARDGGTEHPAIADVAQAAWRAYCQTSTQRAAAERTWRVPQ